MTQKQETIFVESTFTQNVSNPKETHQRLELTFPEKRSAPQAEKLLFGDFSIPNSIEEAQPHNNNSWSVRMWSVQKSSNEVANLSLECIEEFGSYFDNIVFAD